jgi:hypothetical protein
MSEHRVGARAHARALVLKAYLSSTVAVGALAAAVAVGLVWPSSEAEAAPQCLPLATGAGPSNTTITCSGGAVTNQNSPNGYGTGNQNNDTINVTGGTTVTGNASFVSDGFLLGTGNTVNNFGTVTGNLIAIQGSGTDIAVNNSGSITSATGGGVFADSTTGTATVTNNPGASINTGSLAIQGASVIVMNSGTVWTNNNTSAIAGQKSTMNQQWLRDHYECRGGRLRDWVRQRRYECEQFRNYPGDGGLQ